MPTTWESHLIGPDDEMTPGYSHAENPPRVTVTATTFGGHTARKKCTYKYDKAVGESLYKSHYLHSPTGVFTITVFFN